MNRTAMINTIEVLINSLLQDFLLRGPKTELCISQNVTGATNALQGQGRANTTNNNMCANTPGTGALMMMAVEERLVYGKVAQRQRMALLLYVLAEVHDLLLTRSTCTYRELYYRNVNTQCSMKQIVKAVQDVSCMLGESSWNLGIFGSGKGMIAGPLSIYMSSGNIIDCSCLTTPTMIPPNFTFIDRFETTAQLILVVEKDTVFKKLMQNNIFSVMQGQVLLVTARGYPDLATRWFLNKLIRAHPMPIYMLADCDPFGIEIMLTYRYGSMKYAQHALDLACPQMKWLGVHPSDITHMLCVPQEPLTALDYKKIDSILKRQYVGEEVRRELIIQKHHQHKAKLDNMSGQTFSLFINDYIVNKIKRQVVI